MILKEWVLKYDNNSYANIGTVRKYMGNNSRRNILQYYAIIGCDATSFFYIIGKLNPFKEVFKNQSAVSIKCLVENNYLSNADVEDFLTFIQTFPYGGNIYECYVEKRICIYDNQKTKFSMYVETRI